MKKITILIVALFVQPVFAGNVYDCSAEDVWFEYSDAGFKLKTAISTSLGEIPAGDYQSRVDRSGNGNLAVSVRNLSEFIVRNTYPDVRIVARLVYADKTEAFDSKLKIYSTVNEDFGLSTLKSFNVDCVRVE